MATQDDGVGNDFDPVKFCTSILDTVFANLSQCPRVPQILVTSPEDVGTGEAGESAPNCFLRLLGMPAVRDESEISFNPTKAGDRSEFLTHISQSSTLNYFTQSSFGSRFGEALQATIDRGFFAGKKQTAADYQEMIENPLPISESLTASGRRPKLLPPSVDASVPIFPLSRRVAPSFNSGDFFVSGGRKRLSRPFIEHVIYMRTKVFSGGGDPELVRQISELIEAETGDEELAAKLPSAFTEVERSIVEKFLQAMRQSAKKYAEVLALAKKLQAEVAFETAPVSNPEQRSITPLSSNPEIGVTTSIGAKIQILNKVLAAENAFLVSLPTESVNRADRIRRIEDEIPAQNIKADVFVSEFVDLLGFERASLEEELAQAKQEERAKIMQVEQVKRDLMFYTGEFVGLSIFDVLCIFYAMFTVELRFLIGLLNNDAKERLKSDPFFKTNQASSNVSQDSSAANLIDATAALPESLTKFEEQVKVAFQLSEFFFSEASSDG